MVPAAALSRRLGLVRVLKVVRVVRAEADVLVARARLRGDLQLIAVVLRRKVSGGVALRNRVRCGPGCGCKLREKICLNPVL